MDSLKSLYSLSTLEQGRIKEPVSDPRNISRFKELESIIQLSLGITKTNPSESQPLSISAKPKQAELKSKNFVDHDFVQKLLQYRHLAKPSHRILKANTPKAESP